MLDAGRSAPISHLVVGSASMLISGGSSLKPPALMPASAKALP